MQINPDIFRAYDIRGEASADELHPQAVTHIGKAFASILKSRKPDAQAVAIGYDGRTSSPALEAALIEGITSTGLDVWRMGLCSTPMLNMNSYQMGADAGIMLTGSHNPAHHNGLKMLVGKSSFYGDDIQELRQRTLSEDYAQGSGTVSDHQTEAMTLYLNSLLRVCTDSDSMRIAWDAGNGSTGHIIDKLVKELPGEHFTLFTDVDGSFPNHHPDPTVPENLTDLQHAVARNRCDFGIALDGDGDRIGVVDNEGSIWWGDELMQLLARDVLSNSPNSTIIADVKASQTLFDAVTTLGGTPLMWKTGHSHIKTKMAELNAPLAGEMSGHIFFADHHGFDDGIYAGLRLMRWLTAQGKTLHSYRKQLSPTFSSPEFRIPCGNTDRFALVETLQSELQAQGADASFVDGVRVREGSGWWLIRASNTQNVVSARAEAASQSELDTLLDNLHHRLEQAGITIEGTLKQAA